MLGDSAGRSRGNRLGEGAERRATQRERAGIDPPAFHPEPTEDASPAWKIANWIVLVVLLLALLAVYVF